MSGATQNAERVIARCRELAAISDVPGQTTRIFLSAATREAHRLLAVWMEAAGLSVWTDAAGNLRALRPGPEVRSPRLLIGSHIDTVPNAGAFDGALGVLLGLELLEELHSTGTALPYAIELIAFSEEEGVRFGKPFLGSLALIGQLDSEMLAHTDAHGISVAEAIRSFGLDPAELPHAAADPATAAYLEFHIEQGPVLESEGSSLAVVNEIAGESRVSLQFVGHANHAGTTPMGPLRRDALATAAEWIVEVERYAGCTDGLVATVGKLEVPSGAVNVVPGAAIATLDVRHTEDTIRRAAVGHLLEFARTASHARQVLLRINASVDQPAVAMDSRLTTFLADAVTQATQAPARLLPSGAGHDAMIMARRFPSAMLFLRSPGGISHHPDEALRAQDVAGALSAGLAFLHTLKL